jgi:periplasmic protein TonB
VRAFRLPLAASILGHGGVLILLALFAAQLPPAPLPQPRKSGIEVMLAPPPQSIAETPPPAPEPPPVAAAEPPPPEPPPPPAAVAMPEPPPPPPKPVVHKPAVKPPPRHPPPPPVRETPPPQPTPRAAPRPAPLQTAPLQTAMFPPPPVPAPAPHPAPTVSPGYRSLLSAWLESHKHYPESARARGEEGRAVLRFRVDRSGRVLNYALAASTGFADLDAAIDGMMRGATLPPFPADMAASDVEVSVTVRFSLTR